MKQEHTYSVKNVKTISGNEGYAWDATLYRDGKRVGLAHYDGWGGGVEYAGVPQDVIEDLRALGALDFAAWQAERGHDIAGDTIGLEDIIVEGLVGEYVRAQDERRAASRMRRTAAKQTLFLLEGEEPAEGYRYITSMPICLRVLFHLRKKYGEGIRVYVPSADAWQPISEAIAPYEGQEAQTA